MDYLMEKLMNSQITCEKNVKDISQVGFPQPKSLDIMRNSLGRTCQITTLLPVNILDFLSCMQHKSEA